MITRKEYLYSQEPGIHRAYYAQFVTAEAKAIVQRSIGMRDLRDASSDPHLNKVALKRWDKLPALHNMDKALREAGDHLTLSGKVCIYKEAALQLLEAE